MNKQSFNITIKNLAQFTLKFFITPLDTLLLISRSKLKISANLKLIFSNKNKIDLGSFWDKSLIASLRVKSNNVLHIPAIKLISTTKLFATVSTNINFFMNVAGNMKALLKVKAVSITIAHLRLSFSAELGKFVHIGVYDPSKLGAMDGTKLSALDFSVS